MQRMSARDAKNGFGRLIDSARAEPVAIEKHGRAVVVVLAFEEYQRLVSNEVNKKPGAENGPRR
jgi:prevent-host-death family protein